MADIMDRLIFDRWKTKSVKANNKFSQWLDEEAGVIQGSVLGPILFIIFISDVNKYIPLTKELTKYADDLGTHNNYKDPKDDKIQLAVDGVETWATETDPLCRLTQTKPNTWLLSNRNNTSAYSPS
jgi:hypothetical protein